MSKNKKNTTSKAIAPKKKTDTKKLVCFGIAVFALIAAIALIAAAVTKTKAANDRIDIQSVQKFTVNYFPDPDKPDYCFISADFTTDTITVKRWTDTSNSFPDNVFETIPGQELFDSSISGSDVSGTDVSGSDVIQTPPPALMQEETQSFSGLDMDELEKFIIEHDEMVASEDLSYDLTEMNGGHKVVCHISILTGDNKFYTREFLTTHPDNWNEFIELVKKTSGVLLEL